MMKLLITE